MAKKYSIDNEALHFMRIEQYVKMIEKLYEEAITEASTIDWKIDPNKPFSFDSTPKTKAKIDKIIKSLNYGVFSAINEATRLEWIKAVENKDELAKSYLRAKFTEEQKLLRANRNLEALQSFQQRKIDGLRLSDKVWRYTNQFKGELEMALDIGIGDGKSAASLGRELRMYLNEPDKLFRRVRDKYGNLQLSKNAKKYNPGPGVYRSSVKNTMRVARTEINMAYRTSDYEKNQQLDFVLGFEVFRSNTHFDCPICERLKGKYPKTFKWTGWHPQDRCHVRTILADEDEFIEYQLSSDKENFKFSNTVTKIPKEFNNWYKENGDRIATSKKNGTVPYFIRDNNL